MTHETALPTVEAVLADLARRGIALPDGPVRVERYGDSAALSDELIALIRSGRKRAGTGLLWGFEADDEALPEAGQLEIIVNHRGEPALVTRVRSVVVQPFSAVSAEYATIEGEGDGSLDYWRAAHWAFFARECARIGRQPVDSMQVVCSVFELLVVVPEATR